MKQFSSVPPAPGMVSPPEGFDKFQEPPIAGIPLYSSDAPQTKKFVVNGFQDVWAAVAFVLCFFATFVWGIVNYASNLQQIDNMIANSTANSTNNVNASDAIGAGTLAGMIFLFLFVATCVALVSLIVMIRFSSTVIIASNIAVAVLQAIGGIVALAQGVVFAGVIMLVFAALQLVWLYSVRSRIPFSALLLKLAGQLLMKYKAIIITNFALVAFLTVYFLFWSSMSYPSMYRAADVNKATGADGILICLFMLLIFWAGQVAFNVMHVTASGVAATWYFVGDGAMPSNPTLASLRRSLTTSFGSICFGSLLVAIIKLMRWIAKSNRRNSDHPFVQCVLECLLACLDRLVEYFNTYAFVHVAIYGCSYLEAAKRTWSLVQQCLFAAVFNDCLVGTTIAMVSLGISAFIGIITAVATSNIAFGFVAFFITLCVHSLVLRSLESFVVTIFVCFAQQPEALRQSSPELYNMICQADAGVHQV